MSNEAIHIRENPTLNFIMKEISEEKLLIITSENERIGKLFYWLAATQILQIIGSAVLVFFVAPASLFVSRTDNDAFAWIAAGFAGVLMIALGLFLIVLSIIAAMAFRKEKSWRNVVGILTASASIFAFPFGTIASGILLWKIFKARK